MGGRGAASIGSVAVAGAAAAAASACARTADPPIPPPPSPSQCAELRAHRELPPITALDPRPGAVRVFAMQFKQEVRHVVTYASYRAKIECSIRDDVVPRLARGEANVVAFNEDVGLATIATGSRGAAAREIAGNPTFRPSCESQGIPCGVAAALAALDEVYARQLAFYRARFPGLSPVSGVFVAATDTFARGFMQTFSDMARRYGIYILGSNDQPAFTESTDPADITALADPDLPRPASVFVATSPDVHNEAFLWAPRDGRTDGPPMMRNLVASNAKVPLTDIENELQLSPGPSSGAAAVDNLRPYRIPGTDARLGFATSLPAFVYGDPPAGVDPCSDTSRWYMRCLDRLGANVVVQDEANPGRWAANGGGGYWQPLEWMGSTWRTVSDPSVGFAYNVTPMMVGNLADLAFDGQSAITKRGLGGAGCHYVGNGALDPGDGDPGGAAGYAGDKPQFLALAPWVSGEASRGAMRDTSARLAPGSNDPLENDYLETALIADLTFPPDPARAHCGAAAASAPARRSLPRLRLSVRPRHVRRGRPVLLRVRASAGRRPVAGALIAMAGRRVRSGRRGAATLTVRLPRPGLYLLTAQRSGYRTARARVRAR